MKIFCPTEQKHLARKSVY